MLSVPPMPKRRNNARKPRFPAGVLLGFGQSDSLSQTLRNAGSKLQFSSMVSRWGVFALQSRGGRKSIARRALSSSASVSAQASQQAAQSIAVAVGSESKKRASSKSRASSTGGRGKSTATGGRGTKRKGSSLKENPRPNARRRSDQELSDSSMACDSPDSDGESESSVVERGNKRSVKAPKPKAPPAVRKRSKRVLSDDESEDKHNERPSRDSDDQDGQDSVLPLLDPDSEFCAHCDVPVLPGEPAMQCRSCTRMVHSECGGLASSSRRQAAFLCGYCRAK